MCRKIMMLNLFFCYMTHGLRHIEDWLPLLNIYERIREEIERERGRVKQERFKTIKDIFYKNILHLHLRVSCKKSIPTQSHCIDCTQIIN